MLLHSLKYRGLQKKENRSQKRKLNNTKEMEVPNMKQVGLALRQENFIRLVGKMEKKYFTARNFTHLRKEEA